MPYIKNYILVIFALISSTCFTQDYTNKDSTVIQNNINYRISSSQIELEKYKYYNAKNNLNEALKLAQEIKNKKSIGLIYTTKSKLELLLKEEDSAIKSISKAIKIQRSIKDNINLGNSHKTFGDIYLYKKDYYSALKSYKTAKFKFRKEKDNQKLAEVLLCEGKVYSELKNYKKAKTILEQSLTIAKKYSYLKIQSGALINTSRIYNKPGSYEKSLEIALSGFQIAKTNNYTKLINESLSIISDLHYKLENYKVSRNYLNTYLKLSDSIRDLTQINSPKNHETQSRLNKQIKKNKEVSKKLEKAQDDNKLGLLISFLSVALIIILSLLTFTLYKNNNIRLKSNNALHKKNEELLIAKEKAELASKTKANFLSTVTHELRTPLYAVTSLSSMLLDENPKPDQIQHLKSLKFSGDYLLTFINDILQVNKIEANKEDVELEVFNLKEKINQILLSLNNSAQNNNVKLHFVYDNGLSENFISDQLKISQILINLVGNSIKFTKDGDIWIRVYKIKREGNIYTLRFEIEDNGIGISQEKQDHMFESFSQGSIEINRKYGGTGLGLSIVKGLIDILKGNVSVKSKLGEGTMFYFEIPLEYTNNKVPEKTNTSYFNGNLEDLDLTKFKILVVEDNKINQMVTKKILTKLNLKCKVVDNGESAIESIKANNYDIVLMDIHMPGISGIEATKRIRTFNKELTIFALTAVTIEGKMHEFDEAGFTGIIPKPFKQEEFERKLYKALSRKS